MNSTCFFPSATLYNMKKYIEECGVGSDLSISVLEKEKKKPLVLIPFGRLILISSETDVLINGGKLS